jgi:hydroxypyruvate isomerase
MTKKSNTEPIAAIGASGRRAFLRNAAVAAAGLALVRGNATATEAAPSAAQKAAGSAFKLRYGPPLGMFEGHAGKDPIDQIKFMADQGFRAMFDNGLMNKPEDVQEAIARELDRHKMALGPFVAYADFKVKSFVTRDPEVRTMLDGVLKRAVATAKRTGARSALVVPGRYDESLEPGYQTANVIENLKWAAGICEPAGLVLVIEPLNPHDHPGLFLTHMPQAYVICKAVASPACKIVDDVYHQQITEGNIIRNIERCWDEIASFHVGDNPGRREPGTGELNYRNIFKKLHEKGYDGVICMEHGRSIPGVEGEKAVIAAYRDADDFVSDKGVKS